SVSVPLGESFHARRLTIKSSQVGEVASSQRARRGTADRMALTLSMLADSALDVLITGESDFETMPELMARLASAPGDTICHRIKYS
ncbi:MAG: dehydrogenase, partial [Parafilimonas sp.]